MTHTLTIRIADREGALVRLIGLIERRGYEICAMAKSAPAAGMAEINVDVTARGGERRIDVLMRQVSRLFDVISVQQPIAAHIAAAATPAGDASCRHPQ